MIIQCEKVEEWYALRDKEGRVLSATPTPQIKLLLQFADAGIFTLPLEDFHQLYRILLSRCLHVQFPETFSANPDEVVREY